METTYYLAVFQSKSHALYVYQSLKRKNLNQYELVSTPCQIKAGCSYSIKFNELEEHKLLSNEAALIRRPVSDVYFVKRTYGRRIIEKVEIDSI